MDALARLPQGLYYWLLDSGLLDRLPPVLLEPPWLWLWPTLLALVVLWAVWSLLRPSIRRFSTAGRRAGSREAVREAQGLMKQGQYSEAGRIFESLGEDGAALKAYERGNCHADQAALLLSQGRRSKALKAAERGGAWQLYADIQRQDGRLDEAAVGYERAGQAYLAGQCYAQLERPLDAARCYLAAGMESEAVQQLVDDDRPEAAELLDQAVRSSLAQTGAAGLSLALQSAVQKGVQRWLANGEAERAFQLAVAAERWKLAVPVARDYLRPSEEAAAICVRAGAFGAAAQIYERLGDPQAAALQRAEEALRRQQPEEAARQFELAERWADAADQWAAAGDKERAAELFRKAGDPMAAAQLLGIDPQAETPSREEATIPNGAVLPVHRPGTETKARPAAISDARTRKPPFAAEAPEDDRYCMLEELGRGGMGIVYRAEDRMLQRQVAYKIVYEHSLSVEVEPEALLMEARAAARLSHPNIVQVYDAGRHGRGFYVVMELIQGQSLEAILAEKQITVAGALRIGLQICSALHHAHQRRIIHRDLKPSNLLWSADHTLKLADFGLARVFESGLGRVATQPAGTPSYMAPEQIRGDDLGPTVDIYSFGCVMFELLCREAVFGTGPPSFHHHLATAPRNPRELRPETPEPLAGLILSCLSKDHTKRPQSAAEIGRHLTEQLKSLESQAL